MLSSSRSRVAAIARRKASRNRNSQYSYPISHLHTFVDGRLRRENDKEQSNDECSPPIHSSTAQIAQYHTTVPTESGAVTLLLGLGAISAGSFAVSSGMTAYRASQEALKQAAEEAAKQAAEKEEQEKAKPKGKPEEQEGDRENIFAKWFGVGVGAKYYEGGFEDEMTKREAALILGVRESSSTQRIKEAHRKLLILNHPDTGGSTYMAGKINEAKELLLKGRRGA